MKNHHILLIIAYSLLNTYPIMSCPCTSSPQDPQPFFEQYDDHHNQQNNEEDEEQ